MMNDVTLESTADEKDLGVVVDEDLKFHLQVSKAVSKASRPYVGPCTCHILLFRRVNSAETVYHHGLAPLGVRKHHMASQVPTR